MLPLDLENDFLKGNIPAKRLYSSMGFKYLIPYKCTIRTLD